jgi:predicted PurR-regulated permease PerM
MTDSSQKKFIKLILWISGTVILLYVLYQLSDIIIIVALSILLSFIFVPFVNSLESRGFNRLTSTLLTYGIFLFLLYLSLSVIIPKFIVQMDQLITALEGFSFDTEMQAFEKSIIAYLPFLKPGDLTIKIEEFITNQFVNSIERHILSPHKHSFGYCSSGNCSVYYFLPVEGQQKNSSEYFADDAKQKF